MAERRAEALNASIGLIKKLGDWLRIIARQQSAHTAGGRGLTRVGIRRGLGEFLDDILGELATFPAVRSHSQAGSQVSHGGDAIATDVADLVIGDLAANTNVHKNIQVTPGFKSK
jgi:hypothetical protein